MLSAITAGLRFPISADNRTRAQFSAIRDDLRGIAGTLSTVQERAARAGRSMRNIGAGMSAAVTAPIMGFGVGVARTAMQFEESMNRVAAVSGATGHEIAALESIAREMGATTRFSAQEAADGLGFLAMAGLSVDDQISALPGILQLAAASGMELAEAADVATNVLGNFGFGVDQLQRVNDVMAATASSANTNVPQLGQAMMEAGALASMAGLEFEEVAAAMGLMANSGFRAGRAGTAMRGGLARLLNPVGQAEEAIREMGLQVLDGEGNMRSLADILTDVAPFADDAALMIKLFGQEAGPGMAALLSAGPEALRDLTEHLRNSGGAAGDMADTMNQGLRGSLNSLASAWGELQLAIADSGFLDVVTGLVDRLTGFVRQLGETNPALLRMGTIAAGVAASLGPLLMGLGLIVIGASVVAPALALLFSPLGLVVLGLAAAAGAAAYLYDKWDELEKRFPILERLADFGSDLAQAWSELPAIKWAVLIPALSWARYIPGLRWAAFVPTIAWAALAGTLRWGALIAQLSWAALRVIPGIGWAALAGSLAWSALVDRIEWNGWIPRIHWASWISRISWDDFLPQIDWARYLIPGRAAQLDIAAEQAGRAVGNELAAGVTLGLVTGRSEVEGAARELMQYLDEAARDEAGIESPSRVFREIGEFLTEGLAVGIGDGGQQPISAMQGLAKEIIDAGDEATRGLDKFGQGFASLIGPVLRGTQTIGDAFASMVSRIGDNLLNSGLRGVGSWLGDILGFGSGAVKKGGGRSKSGGLGAILGALLPFEKGGVFAGGSVMPFADGGVVSRPTLFPMRGGQTGLMGEAGPEAIMPLARGSDGRLGVRASGGGGEVVIHVQAEEGAMFVPRVRAEAQGVAVRVTQAGITEYHQGFRDYLVEANNDPHLR